MPRWPILLLPVGQELLQSHRRRLLLHKAIQDQRAILEPQDQRALLGVMGKMGMVAQDPPECPAYPAHLIRGQPVSDRPDRRVLRERDLPDRRVLREKDLPDQPVLREKDLPDQPALRERDLPDQPVLRERDLPVLRGGLDPRAQRGIRA